MPVRIGICDDCAEDRNILSTALYAYDESFRILTYANGGSLLDDILENKILFDILFLDIYMSGLNGIEIARKIRTEIKDLKIVFISSSNEHYSEAYDIFAFNYLIKPLNPEKLDLILDQALINIDDERRHQINFSYKSVNYRIFCRDILYVESRDKIVLFHMKDKATLQCYAKVDEILKQLPQEYFIRCHQSFAVNIFYVSEMAESYFCVGSTAINMSKKYKKESKDKYFDYLFKHMDR